MIRKSEATWQGGLRGGKGTVKLGPGHYEGPYTWASRFESGTETNPEEMIAAAHAACYSMALSADLEKGGHTATSVHTVAEVSFERQEQGWRIIKITLVTEAKVPGIDEAAFSQFAEGAKTGCPISNALKAVPIELKATLLK